MNEHDIIKIKLETLNYLNRIGVDNNESERNEKYKFIYHDLLRLFAINKCLQINSFYVKNKIYEESYAQGELIDHRDKRIEKCLNNIFEIHNEYNDLIHAKIQTESCNH